MIFEFLKKEYADWIDNIRLKRGEITIELSAKKHAESCEFFELIKNDSQLQFDILIDVCGVDYMEKPRFGVVYHFLSTILNHRLRVKILIEDGESVESVTKIWPAADWFEREAFDLMGIEFKNHPDLRRILTDYNFEGHPLRKDFPVSGHVEMRYDAAQEKVIYEPVDIEPRTLVHNVKRSDNRYVK